MGDGGTLLPPKLKSVSLKKSVSVKIGNFSKIGISIGMLFLLEEKIGIGIYFTESVSVSVRLKVKKSVRISIG